MKLRICNFLLAVVFAVFALFQVNDALDPKIYHKPSGWDAMLWFLFYLLIAILFVVINWRPLPQWLFVVAVLACVAEMVTTGPGLWENVFGERDFEIAQNGMSAADPRVELSREFFGALIALVAVLFLWWQSRKKLSHR